MIISKKKFNEAIEKAVNEAVEKERENFDEVSCRERDYGDRRRSEDNIWRALDENRRNLIDVTRELNHVVMYLCDKEPDFAKKEIEQLKRKSTAYTGKNAISYCTNPY